MHIMSTTGVQRPQLHRFSASSSSNIYMMEEENYIPYKNEVVTPLKQVIFRLFVALPDHLARKISVERTFQSARSLWLPL